MDRALPGWAVDLIRDGVSPADLKARGGHAVFKALVQTAASAQMRGQDAMEWEYLVLDAASRLGLQVRLKDGHKTRTPRAVAKTLGDAWERAWEWRSEQSDTWSRSEVRTRAEERAGLVDELVADADADLDERERAVLAYAADQTRERGMLRVALPWRAVRDAAGLSERTTKSTLARLQERGLLHLEVRGYGGATRRRANLFGLPAPDVLAPYLCRETRPMGPPPQTYGTSESNRRMGPPQPYGTSPTSAPQEETDMATTLTLTLKPQEEALVLAVLASARAASTPEQSTPGQVEHPEADGNVVPIGSRARTGGAA